MATIKLTIDKRRPFKDGRCSIVYRLTSNKKSTYIASGIKVFSKEWDISRGKILKTHTNYKSLNLHLAHKLLELEKKLIEIEGLESYNLGQIKDTLLEISHHQPPEDRKFHTSL